ncbi:MAG: hypothetical protein JWM41_3697 [Gemmatimonadetes bacterium]|nr:hypothetical protein [Gemmatimonadota bacterium]
MLPFVIRAEQMRTLRAPFLAGFVDDARQHAQRRHPDVVATMGDDGLDTHVRDAIAEAVNYDLVSKRDVLRYLSLTLTFGLRWRDSPDRRWMHEAMSAGAPTPSVRGGSARLHALYREVLARLSRNEIADRAGA